MDVLKTYIAADTVVDSLATRLRRETGGRVEGEIAPYNQIQQTLLGPAKAPLLLLWSSPDLQLRNFERVLSGEAVDLSTVMAEVDAFANLLRSAAGRYERIFHLTWTLPPDRGVAVGLSGLAGFGCADILARANIRLADQLADVGNIQIIDLSHLQAMFDGAMFDPRLNVLGRMRFAPDFVAFVARRLAPVLEATVRASRKLIVCDLDNTLWGGIIGDDGLEGIRIGNNNPVGEAHLKIQRELKSLKNRGILLAISSKNSEEIALDAIDNHPTMLLRREDFVARRINWDDKAANIISMLDELKLLPNSVVFLDDNPVERQRVRDAIPDILVPELPKDVAYWSGLIADLGCFETLGISAEDLKRTESYVTEAKRVSDQSLHASLGEWLKSLALKVTVQPLNTSNLKRSAQLVNKTNQFNLHTRRLGEAEFEAWCAEAGRECYTFSVADCYGDYGLTGVVTVETRGGRRVVEDFVMSCRVLGKAVEDAILAEVLSREPGLELEMVCIPTPKNAPIREFVDRIAPNGVVPPGLRCPDHIEMVRD